MTADRFAKRKADVLSKRDKSFIGKWDSRIAELCEKINSFDCYYTTSSCSGRIAVMIDKDKKEHGLFIKVYHELLEFYKLKKDLDETAGKYKELIKFKLESCALHVACCNLKSAQRLVDLAWRAGWKKSGIITTGKRFVIELTSTEKLEFPAVYNKKVLVDDDFLRIAVKRANDKLEKAWEKIEKLCELLN